MWQKPRNHRIEHVQNVVVGEISFWVLVPRISGLWNEATRVEIVPQQWNMDEMMFTTMSVAWRILAQKITTSGSLGYSTSENR